MTDQTMNTVLALNVDQEVHEITTNVVDKKKKVNDKHYKFMAIGYWLLKQLNVPESGLADVYDKLKFFASNDEVVAFYDEFDLSLKERMNEFKLFQKSQKTTTKKPSKRNILVHNNVTSDVIASPEEIPVVVVATAPVAVAEKKKRVKKVKEVVPVEVATETIPVVDTIESIVEAARAPVETKPKKPRVKKVVASANVLADQEVVATTIVTPADQEVVATAEKPAKKPRVKKQPKPAEVASDVMQPTEQVSSKKENAIKAVNTLLHTVETSIVVEPVPVVVEPEHVVAVHVVALPIAVVEKEEGEIDDDDEEEVITVEVVIDGVMYLKDYDGNLYHRETHEFLRNVQE